MTNQWPTISELRELLHELEGLARFGVTAGHDEYDWDESDTSRGYECVNKAKEFEAKLRKVTEIYFMVECGEE